MKTFRVLLIDDEEELVSALVERLGYREIEAEFALNGPEALRKIEETHFDVIVLDLKLPGMGGMEVLKHIKKLRPHIPVLMITGHGAVVEENQEKPEEAYDFLQKPMDIQALIVKMQEAVRDSHGKQS
jgi:DNA-binding NtrC family response regulator